jgi:hypothetical protein
VSAASNGNNAAQGSRQTGEAETLDHDGRKALKARGRPQALPAAAVGAVAPHETATSEIAGLNSFADKALQGRAAAVKTAEASERGGADLNAMRSAGAITEKRHAIPPLEDRFNVMQIGLVEREYHFRDQAGKVAFTDKLLSISTGSESPAAIKAMVDRAAERGWETMRLEGSPEFVRQGWIAATAQGLTAVGHTPTAGDREVAAKERMRLQVNQDASPSQRPGEAIHRVQSAHVERVVSDRSAAEIARLRQLETAIEKALIEGKVPSELRGQVRAMMKAEGARRVAKGERFKVPVYDARAPRPRATTVQAGPQRRGDRERSR